MRLVLALVNTAIKYVKENKRVVLIGLFAIIGVFLVIISARPESDSESQNTTELTLDEYQRNLEEEIASLCSDVDGVGKCRVFITFERGAQSTYKGSTMTETKPPRVLGVTVICSGGESDSVRRSLSDMLCALFDIGYNRVAILKLNS